MPEYQPQPVWGSPDPAVPPPTGGKPFYRKVAFWIVVGLLLFMGGCLTVVGNVATDPSLTTSATNAEGISRGAGSADASADVQLGDIAPPDAIGIRYGIIHITNHSSEASDYYIELRVLDASGTNIGMANATADRVLPGGKARVKYMIAEEDAARVEITEIQRTASL